MASSDLHDHLTGLSATWLRRQGFPIVATEINAAGCREQADAIGFRSSCSAIIEAKVSRADFMADQRKPERTVGGLGIYRFYLCPEGVIEIGDLPPRWGLLYADGPRVREIVRPKGNIWPGLDYSLQGWTEFQHKPDDKAERRVLFSIARRLAGGQEIQIRKTA